MKKKHERKNRVQLYQLLQVNSSASICAIYCTKQVPFPLTQKKMINLVLVYGDRELSFAKIYFKYEMQKINEISMMKVISKLKQN